MSQEFNSFINKLINENKLCPECLYKLLTEFEFPNEPMDNGLFDTQIQLSFTHVHDESIEGSLFDLINLYEEFIEELLQVAEEKADSFCKRIGCEYIRCSHEYLNNRKRSILNLIQKSLTGAGGYKEHLNDRLITAEEVLGEKFIIVSIKFGLYISPSYGSELIILPSSEAWEVNKYDPSVCDKLSTIELAVSDL